MIKLLKMVINIVFLYKPVTNGKHGSRQKQQWSISAREIFASTV